MPPADPVAATLQPLLARQLQALRGRFLRHGLACVLAATAAAVLLFFALDRSLALPLPIRLLHTAVCVGLMAFGVQRWIRYPLQRPFAELDVAVWFERTFPDLHQRMISALQLGAVADDGLRNQSRAMIERLCDETAEAVAALPLARLFDGRTTARYGALALLGLGLLTGGAAWSPATAKAFVLRHLGLAADYPRDTTLHVELPAAGPELQREDRPGVTELVLPAGADLHVAVSVTGVVPKEVFLDVYPLRGDERLDARSLAMAPRPGERFRHVFRRLSGAFEFHARGGDDANGDRRVVVHTVQPPQVATIVARTTPPAYTRLPAQEQAGGVVEALIGSEAQLDVTTTSAVKTATVVFLESGKRLNLGPQAIQDDSATANRWTGRFPVLASDRYQVELVADNGLRNPNPGTYPIVALPDTPPVGRWLLPEDEGLSLLPEGLLCVRIDAHDDFGLAEALLTIERGGKPVATRPLLAARAPTEPLPTARVATEFLEVKDLLGAGAGVPTPAQDGLVLQLRLADGRQPEPAVAELPRRIVQLVDAQQLAATIARLFRSLREETEQALEVQTDRGARLAELERPADGAADASLVLTAIEVGQGRVGSAAERIHQGLMRAFDLHLWNRLEPSQHAATVVDLYRRHAEAMTEPLALDPAFYRDLAARRAAGNLGALEQTLDPLLAMLTLADGITAQDAPALLRTLTELQVADGAARGPLLQRARQLQQRIEQALRQLLERLQDWNDYQDLVQEVRALRDRQRDLQQRTEDARGKK